MSPYRSNEKGGCRHGHGKSKRRGCPGLDKHFHQRWTVHSSPTHPTPISSPTSCIVKSFEGWHGKKVKIPRMNKVNSLPFKVENEWWLYNITRSGKLLSPGELRWYLCAWYGEEFTKKTGEKDLHKVKQPMPEHTTCQEPPLSSGDCSWWAGQSVQVRRSSARETPHRLTERCASCFPWSLSTGPGAHGNLIAVYCHESQALPSCNEVRQPCFSRQKSTCWCLDCPRMEHSTSIPTVCLGLLF